ncbi:hypothetical protein [Ruegeria sp.]|uniref:hypothetical protein n=1 Tax=Ruegeria sp. TaxID=1879320 RepID=UPI003B001FAC
MKSVFFIASLIGGAVFCYILFSLGVVDKIDGIPGVDQEPVFAIPTYLSFISAMMTAVTVVLAAVAIGIGVVAAYTFREIKDEAQRVARTTAQKIAQHVADERLSEVKVKGMVLDLYAKAEEERQQDVKWGEDPSEEDEKYER